jgi:hypothetical protein
MPTTTGQQVVLQINAPILWLSIAALVLTVVGIAASVAGFFASLLLQHSIYNGREGRRF